MCKQAFLDELREHLTGLPQEDIEERLGFYAEMIEDRVEDGLTEEEAVAAIGSVEEVFAQIIEETPFTKLVKERIRTNRKLAVWEIVLLAVGSPIWLALLIAAFAVVLSLYVVLWSVVASLWSVFAALAASALGVLVGGVVFLCYSYTSAGLVCIAASLVCAGLSIFAFYGCKATTKGGGWLTKKLALFIKTCFIRKGAVK